MGGVGGGRSFEFEWEGRGWALIRGWVLIKMDAYSRRAIIRGWALMRINTVPPR